MSLNPINTATPKSAIYAQPAVNLSNQRKRRPRQLSTKQLRLPFFRAALATMQLAGECRKSLLPRLLYRANSGRKTRSEIYEALAAAAEPMLARLDLATGVLGWLDKNGNFRLNNQKGIARDAGLSSSVFNRLIKVLAECGYVHKQVARIGVKDQQHGAHLIRTRVLIRFTSLFFADLGLSLRYGLAKRNARKRRKKALIELERQKLEAAHAELAKMLNIQENQQKFKARERARIESNHKQQEFYIEQKRQVLAAEYKQMHPHMSVDDVYRLVDKELA